VPMTVNVKCERCVRYCYPRGCRPQAELALISLDAGNHSWSACHRGKHCIVQNNISARDFCPSPSGTHNLRIPWYSLRRRGKPRNQRLVVLFRRGLIPDVLISVSDYESPSRREQQIRNCLRTPLRQVIDVQRKEKIILI
jgi:hypothetical protein